MKIFSFDAETNGLYGNTFAIAAVVRENGTTIAEFVARVPDEHVTDPWVIENILPHVQGIKITHSTTEEMEEDFWTFLQEHKGGADVVVNVPYPVETSLLRRCVERDMEARQFAAPFPLFDVASAFRTRGIKPENTAQWVRDQDVMIDTDGTDHNPLFDAVVAAQAWELLVS